VKRIEVNMPLHKNGTDQIVFRPNLKTTVLLLTILGSVITAGAFGIDWYKGVQDTTSGHKKLQIRVDTLELVTKAELASQRVLIEAMVKKLMPENYETIIKLSKVKKTEVETTLNKQNREK